MKDRDGPISGGLPSLVSFCSREPGLVDRVLALHAGSPGFDPTRGTCPNDFSDPTDQDICTLSWKIVVSEWQSVIAVSLNVGGGARLIKQAKLCMCTQITTNTTRTDFVDLLFYVHGKRLRSCRDGQLT